MLRRRVSSLVAAGLVALALAACGGGGSAPSGANANANPTPQPTASAGIYQVRYIIDEDGSINLEVFPADGQPVAPPGGQVGQPDGGAVVTYPDGSTQAADAAGDFIPAQSAYAQGNIRQLETSSEAQPYVIVSDPQGKAAPTSTDVTAYNGATVASASFARRPVGGLRLTASTGPVVSLGGVRTLPAGFALFANEIATVHVEGVDIDGHLASLRNAQVSWKAALGKTTQIAGTRAAVYAPPAIGGASPALDTITATVTFAGSSLQFTATSRVQVFPPGAGFALSGSALANGSVLFVQADVPRVFHPYFWLTSADGTGQYRRSVPANVTLTSILGIPPSPGGVFSYAVANNSFAAIPSQPSQFTSGVPGASATANLTLPSSPVGYIDTAGLARNAIPPLIPYLRDAYAATIDALARHVYDADSGVQALLAAPPSAASLPSPAVPQLVTTGIYYHWCYQWEMLGGAETLVLEENAGTTCGSGGNDAVTVIPGSAAGAYSYVHLYLSSGAYNAAGPTLDPTGGGAALLADAGSWTQTLQQSSGTITSDAATVQIQSYNLGHQTLGTPAFDETLAYQYTLNPGTPALATIQIANDTLSDHADGEVLQLSNRTKTQVHPLHGSGGCVTDNGAPVTGIVCYTVSGSLTRTYYVSSGPFAKNFAIGEKLDGDGSSILTYVSRNAGDASGATIPIASYEQRATSGCLVCAAAPGTMLDVDGSTNLASFTVDRARLVQMNLLDNGQPVGALAFGL
ncbi:hypothetical protein EPN44_14470 [bacterium]|nr:MAG: hypothetical protein EPN44_14470 [bacterium]